MLNGYSKAAREAAEFNLRNLAPLVEQGVALVASEPTASFAFKVHYPDYVGGQPASNVANAFHDLGEFLVRFRADHPESAPEARPLRAAELTAGAADKPLRVAYHLPCHLKAQQVGSPGAALLEEIPGLELIDINAGCCGMAGTFGMKARSFDLSMAAGSPVFDRIREIQPDLVATECSTCRMQIAQATGLHVVHPVRLLADAYRS
jgi:glycerol-3-phosphate dehydrogenase subunit C